MQQIEIALFCGTPIIDLCSFLYNTGTGPSSARRGNKLTHTAIKYNPPAICIQGSKHSRGEPIRTQMKGNPIIDRAKRHAPNNPGTAKPPTTIENITRVLRRW